MSRKAIRWIALILATVCVASVLLLPVSAAQNGQDGSEYIIITLDPGHGGRDGGAVGKHNGTAYTEADLCWIIANYCKEYLESNYSYVKVYLTRDQGENPSLRARVNYAVSVQSDFLLSIHLNSTGTGRARGATMLVPKGSYNATQGNRSKAAAASILEELNGLGIYNRGLSYKTTNNVKYPNGTAADIYYLIRYGVNANLPTVIAEHCFLDSYSDWSNFLSSEAKLKALGEADARGLAKALGLIEIPVETEPTDITEVPETTEPSESTEPVETTEASQGTEPAESTEPVEATEAPETTEPEEIPQTTSSAQKGDTVFTDVLDTQWYYDDITFVYSRNLMNGMSETTFEPETAASRAMVVTLLYRLAGASGNAESCTFRDLSEDDWFYQAVEWAYVNGITTGISDTEFAPNQSVTREQFVTFLYRYAGAKGYISSAGQSLDGYADGTSLSDYAENAMSWAVAAGLVKGYDDSTLRPQNSLSRSELAALMHRFTLYLESFE